ncbi:MAG: aminodeoxychorismate/anthranilate synthase component II [Bacteroidetes bacterium]|jgi:anthranilate synthase component 2|nr:aminodeoxychorismate/anthranilate synthase component II [Bacteroidota bacterium]MDF1865452.1 aminodeoxychorismate/anthranilate synthase component II [Saprospiraceae bacterium]
MNLLVIDNYDSFTYNLVQYIQEILGHKIPVIRNDKITLEEVDNYDQIILSPGPGVPSDAGIMPEIIKKYAHSKAILGVCLGHQAIAEAFGGTIHNLKNVFHGVETPIEVIAEDDLLFKGIPKTFIGGRYHSWVVEKETLPDELEITATDERGSIMAMKHKFYNVRGLQFHPESVMTECGMDILRNWITAQREIESERSNLSGTIA